MVTDQAGDMIALGQGVMPVTTVERQRAFKICLFALGRITMLPHRRHKCWQM